MHEFTAYGQYLKGKFQAAGFKFTTVGSDLQYKLPRKELEYTLLKKGQKSRAQNFKVLSGS